MSDIPRARDILTTALRSDDAAILRMGIEYALQFMTRERPDFIAPVEHAPLTTAQKLYARSLRSSGMSIHNIAVELGTNQGRISEAINEQESVS